MDSKDMIALLCAWVDDQKYPFQIPNSFIYGWESDYWIMTRGGETREFEIKISRSDYFRDAAKPKHGTDDGANYFYYVVPAGLIKNHEVAPKYGLIYIHPTGMVSVQKPPRRLNNNTFDRWQVLAIKMYWRWRPLWREKFIENEITHLEYRAGFMVELEKEEKL